MDGEIRSEEERQAAIDDEIEGLFHSSLDLSLEDLPETAQAEKTNPNKETPLQRARRQELTKVIIGAREILLEKLEEGNGKVGATIQETFATGEIKKPVTDRLIEAVPSAPNEKMIVLTDLHGDTTVLKEAIRRFYEDGNTHLAVLGDMVAGGGKDQIRTLEVLLKLYTEFPDRVHLLRGNCEAAVFPHEGMSDDLYESMGMVAWRQMRGRLQDLFYQLPALIVTENGVALTHGSLPKPKIGDGEKKYRNLQEINDSANFTGSVLFPAYTELGQSAQEKISSQMAENVGRDPILADMLWGDIDTSVEDGYKGIRSFVSGSDDIKGGLKAIGATAEIRGHQSKLLKQNNSNVVVDGTAPITTFHSSFKGNKSTACMAEIPLDRPVDKITEDMFIGVEKEQK